VRLRSTFRVASPLVMATRATRARHAAVHLGRRACSQIKPLPPASQEVVPHETASELGINLSGFAALRLRQGNSAQTTHLSPRNFKLAIHSEGRRPERASCEAGCERSTTWRSPLRRLPLVYPTRKRAKAADAARTFGVMHAKASESGGRGGRGEDLWRDARQSERMRAPEAKLQQPAQSRALKHVASD
jgi:hypothetical protein